MCTKLHVQIPAINLFFSNIGLLFFHSQLEKKLKEETPNGAKIKFSFVVKLFSNMFLSKQLKPYYTMPRGQMVMLSVSQAMLNCMQVPLAFFCPV